MSNWRRLILMAAALGLVAVGCGRGIDESAAGVTSLPPPTSVATTIAPTTQPPVEAAEIVVWVPVRSRAAVAEAAAAFTTATGIGVAIESVELDEMEQAISSGVGPDIFMGRHTWLARLAPRGLAVPLGLEPRVDEFEAVAGDAFTYQGLVYGAPATMESIALFINSRFVQTIPGAFSEIKEACIDLRGTDDTTTTTTSSTTTTVVQPLGAGCVEFLQGDARISLALVTSGDGYLYRRVEGEYFATDVGLAADSAVTRAGTLRSLVQDGIMAGADDQAEMVARFANGETPFLLGDIGLAEAISSSGTPFTVSPLPIITGTTPRPFVEVTGFMLAGRSAQQQTALLFLTDYLITGAAMADIFGSSAGLPAYAATASLVASDPVLAGLQAAATAGIPTPTVDGIDDVMATLGGTLAAIFEADGADVDAVLDEAVELALALSA